ncbi:heparinase II/III family protein [Lactobacillus sp. ESL0679]|uniref:heparinase II/III family protein n=1 Tax=Lactobacillus sp. ESL0679 TaxID=2983209 RepID=UPI0023F7961C|nr:heparinase II/III family protein [Lactobacillus sp. ESL0679]MDF7683562.1 heparinase II/III family protein [Lactobacillus sp. ESL0679]
MNELTQLKVKKLIDQDEISYATDYLANSKLLLNNKFSFHHVYDMEPSPTTYHMDNWTVSPNGDPEWLYVLKRQEYLQDLLYSYIKTNNPTYLEKIKTFIFDWIINNDENEEQRYITWRTIDTGIRLLNWTKPLSYLLQKQLLNDDEITRINQSVNRQAMYLHDNYIEKYDLSNWGVLITTGILTFAAEHPEVIDSSLVNWAESKLSLELKLQVDATGLHWEQSPLYFIEVFRSSLCVVASYLAHDKQLPTIIASSLKAMLKTCYYQIKPDGYILQQGDTDAIKIADLITSAKYILFGIKEPKVKQDFLLMSLADQAKILIGAQEKQNNCYFDSLVSGNFYYKDLVNHNYWHIYNGSLGSGHGHAASGHLDLTINNDNLLIDPGRYTYVNSPERRNLKSGFSHNVVLVDNGFPTRPRDSWKYQTIVTNQRNEVEHYDLYDLVKISYYDKSNDCIVTRYFIWLKEVAIMTIIDVAECKGKHLQSDNWIFAPEVTCQPEFNNSYLITNGVNQYELFHSLKNGQLEKQMYSPRYNELESTTKLILSNQFTDNNLAYTVIGKKSDIADVHYCESKRIDEVIDDDVHSFGVEIDLSNNHRIVINIQHENTIIGNKLYFVGGVPCYGNVSVNYE